MDREPNRVQNESVAITDLDTTDDVLDARVPASDRIVTIHLTPIAFPRRL
jgi:hypothetical protein